MADHDDFETLLERSSLGTPGARRLRARTAPARADYVHQIIELRNIIAHSSGTDSENARRELAAVLRAVRAGGDPEPEPPLGHTRVLAAGTRMELYFFLSYARADDDGAAIAGFYRDLRAELARRNSEARQQPVFRDVEELFLGADWERRLSEALGNCRAMVALYSPAYFASVYCGKEWTAFQARCADYQRETGWDSGALVPVLWEPLPDGPPSPVDEVHYNESAMGERYAELGLRRLIQSEPGGTDYRRVVEVIAGRISRAVGRVRLPVLDRLNLRELPGAFPIKAIERPMGDLSGTVAAAPDAPTRSQPPTSSPETTDARLVLDLSQADEPRVSVQRGGASWSHLLTRRHAELLRLLVTHQGGRTIGQLAEDMFGDPSRTVTVRAELARLRRYLGGLLDTRPYRIADSVQVEVVPSTDLHQLPAGSSAADPWRELTDTGVDGAH